VETAAKELVDLVKKYCNGEVHFELLDSGKKETILDY